MKNLRQGITRASLVAALLCLAMAAGSGPAAAADRTAALDELIKAAKAEGGTIIGHSIIEDVRARKDVLATMKKMYGIDVKWEYVDFPNQNRFAARLMKEAKAGRQPSTDVFNGTQSTIPRLLKANMLAEVKNWRELYPRLPEDAIVPGGGAIPEHTRIGGFAYNTRLVPKDKVPTKLEDLLDPFWKGKLASTTYAAVWDRASVSEQGTFDEEKAARIRGLLSELVKKGHIVGLIGCGDENRIASGEFVGLAMMCSANNVWKGAAKGAPLGMAYIEETNNLSHSYMGLLKQAKYPNTAKLFMVFMQTPEGQALNRKWELADTSYYPENTMYKIAKDLRDRGVAPPYISIPTYMKVKPQVEKWKSEYKKILVGQKK
ncbi:MAG: ABC transporter substrate-binding protein [Deltaproteobacteria bacterium]|nr:ABC transporter substrate-binding protein [Deltaproteobacteria bacterium]MDE0343948.1 ABC transporter substrate-binding protein [Deltaproteobacteria bacterium]